jgi:predicted RNA-binding protein (virulence factor B family)
MKAIEFCYWLQGLFEINTVYELNENQVNVINKHLQMVFVHEKEDSKYLDFCKNLSGYIKFSNMLTMNMSVTTRVKEALNDLFEHVLLKKEENIVTYHKSGMQLHSSDVSELIKC